MIYVLQFLRFSFISEDLRKHKIYTVGISEGKNNTFDIS